MSRGEPVWSVTVIGGTGSPALSGCDLLERQQNKEAREANSESFFIRLLSIQLRRVGASDD